MVGGGQGVVDLTHVEAAESPFAEDTTGRDQLFVEALALAAENHEAAVGNGDGVVQRIAGDDAGRDAREFLPPLRRPHLGAEETQTHLDQAVAEVGEDHVVPAGGQLVVEDHRADLLGVGVVETLGTRSPAPAEWRQAVGGGLGTREVAGHRDRPQGGLFCELEADLDGGADVVRGEAQLLATGVEALVEALNPLPDVPLDAQHCARGPGAGGIGVRVEAVAVAEHRLLHLAGDHVAEVAEVLADLLHLLGGPHEELQVAVEVAGRGVGGLRPFDVARPDEVEDGDLVRPLAVAVDAAVALLHAIRVPRDLVVDEARAMALEADPLGGGIGGEEDAHRGDARVGLEGRLDALPLIGVHAAVGGEEAPLLGETMAGEDGLQPVLGGAVLGEEDHPRVVPLATGT